MPSKMESAFLAIFALCIWSTYLSHKHLDGFGAVEPTTFIGDVAVAVPMEERQKQSDEVEVSACLLIMDGNHFLIEWLAYHYHTANLRHLIIHSDKDSRTLPTEVLDRWRTKITIQEWNETDFVEPSELQGLDSYKRHRKRQLWFNYECLKDLKRQGREWAIIIDPDEYLVPSEQLLAEYNNAPAMPRPTIPDVLGSLRSLRSLRVPFGVEMSYNPCIPIRRRQFSIQESSDEIVQSMVPPGFEGNSFQTLRWRKFNHTTQWYITKSGDECEMTQKLNTIPIKVIIDLHRLDPKALSKIYNGSPHRPLEICPDEFTENTPFVANHYYGTKDQWLHRSNDSRSKTSGNIRWANYQFLGKFEATEETDFVRPWLKDFVAQVGSDEALRLLKDVGRVDQLPEEENISNINNIYSVGDVLEVEYNRHPGDWYEAEVVMSYPNDLYSVVFLDDCLVQHTSLDEMRPRKNERNTILEKTRK